MRLGIAIVALLTACRPAAAVNANLTCDVTADPALIRAEGLSERLGEIILVCSAISGDTVSGNLALFVSAPVTNRLTGETVDVVMTAETATGVTPIGGSPLLIGNNSLFFSGFTFQLPANGRTTIRISNIRVANPGATADRQILVTISTTGPGAVGLRNNPVTAGITRRGLLASASTARIVCLGSPVPEQLSFSNLIAQGTRSASFRITEGFPTAFERMGAGATNGVRVLVKYAGFPGNARLFVPNVVVGSPAVDPTSAGEFGAVPSGGSHQASSTGSLLLSLVRNADPAGSGGAPLFVPGAPGSGAVSFEGVSEIRLQGGAGFVVYEVVDGNANAFETAQLATFIGLPPLVGGDAPVATASLSFAPVSSVPNGLAGAPILRFQETAPEQDCRLLNDCRAPYFPRLFVDSPDLRYRLAAGTRDLFGRHIRVLNDGGGVLNWRTVISYRNGSGWLSAFPAAGVNNASVTLRALAENLAPGEYEAVFTIDGGPIAGSQSFAVALTVTAAQPPPGPAPQPAPLKPVAWQVGNAANGTVLALVPGSMATLKGTRLSGRVVAVRFNGVAARVVFSIDGQINLIVPPELGLLSSAQMVIEVDGVVSDPQTVPVALSAPAIFPAGVLNQDGFANTAVNPELVGNLLQVFATGLPLSRFGLISAKIHDRLIERPVYAGSAPGHDGVQQVNFPIPDDLPAMTTEVIVCGAPVSTPLEKTCSPPVLVTLRR
ncbi:MAG: hypothetical protein FJW20_22655 [Acidimicrobiia bacterium]|nr:hypothetical protein [Acidimicrobiia bacterium]